MIAVMVLPKASGNRFQFCVCSVGDSLAYVYSKVPERDKEIRRIKKDKKKEREDISSTLTAAVVLPTAGGNRFQFCVNVGDSLAYVYSKVPESG